MSLESLKRSRAAHLGIITKDKNKYTAMETMDPDSFNVRKLQEAIKRVEHKLEELQQTQGHIMEHEEVNTDDETKATEHFEEQAESTIDCSSTSTKST